MVALEREFYGCNISVPWSKLDSILEYRTALKRIFSDRLDCNGSYHWLEEAVYPIDFEPEAIEELIEADDEFWEQYRANKWRYPECYLLVLAANSD